MTWRRMTAVAIATMGAFLASGCGGTETEDGWDVDQHCLSCIESNPRMNAPDTVDFGEVNVGGSTTETVGMANDGDEILDMFLELEEGREDDRKEFHPAGDWPTRVQLAPGESIELGITYAPKNGVTDSGALRLETNDPANREAEIRLEPADLGPRVLVDSRVGLSAVPGETAARRLTIENQGRSPLDIRKLAVTGSQQFEVRRAVDQTGAGDDTAPAREEDAPISEVDGSSLQPGESVDLRVYFAPVDDSPERGELVVLSNDPERPQVSVALHGNVGSPCLAANPPEEISFGAHQYGTSETETVTLGNCRPEERGLTIREIRVTGEDSEVFRIDEETLPGSLADGGEYVVESDEEVGIDLVFRPDAKRVYQAELVVMTDDPARWRHDIRVIGKGTSDEGCPTAEATASLEGRDRQTADIETLPLETIQLDGTASFDWDGSVERYEWSIIDRPRGSTARLTPSSTVAKPELFLDRAGEYRVELIVYDDRGNASGCRNERAIVEINACSCSDIHVQLVWETPADPDPVDGDGADLDLHYLNPKGTWNEAPYDIYGENKTADWGRRNFGSDDPVFEIDDTEGGPENITHNEPKNGLSYSVGVYARDDNGFGPSYATVRIYADGQLKKEYKHKYLEPGQFWEVALIEWPTKNVSTRDEVHDGFPETDR